jgi:S1-C subfamily serine protease
MRQAVLVERHTVTSGFFGGALNRFDLDKFRHHHGGLRARCYCPAMVIRSLQVAVLCLAASIIAGCSAATDVESRDFLIQQNSSLEPVRSIADERIAKLVNKTSAAYVTLVVSDSDGNQNQIGSLSPDRRGKPATSGSGFVVERSGYVVTAAHVALERGNAVSARAANGRVYSGTVVDVVPSNDIALIRLRGYSGIAVNPAQNACLETGNFVYSLGRPHDQGNTVRVGSVRSTSFGRPVAYGKFGYPDAMVLELGTEKGESGGPLFNESGEFIGMVVSSVRDGSNRSLNMAHAIPAPAIARVICSNVECSEGWRKLSTVPESGCKSL